MLADGTSTLSLIVVALITTLGGVAIAALGVYSGVLTRRQLTGVGTKVDEVHTIATNVQAVTLAIDDSVNGAAKGQPTIAERVVGQDARDIDKAAELVESMRWHRDALQLIAGHLGVDLPPEPLAVEPPAIPLPK